MVRLTCALVAMVTSCQWASLELYRNKRTESRFRGIISILYCSKQRKMQIIPLNLDSVLLFLHNSKLAYCLISDKAVNKNDTSEVISYLFTSEMISYHFTCLNCPIKEIVIIWLDQSGCTFYFRFRLTPGAKFGGKNCFAVLSTLSSTSTWWLDFFLIL